MVQAISGVTAKIRLVTAYLQPVTDGRFNLRTGLGAAGAGAPQEPTGPMRVGWIRRERVARAPEDTAGAASDPPKLTGAAMPEMIGADTAAAVRAAVALA